MDTTTRSITAEDGEDGKREISAMITMIMRYIERLDEKRNIMISLADTLSKNVEKKKEFIACTETEKSDHFNLKKRFAVVVSSYPFEEDSTVLFPQIKAFMKQELDKFDELRRLCAKFLSDDDGNFTGSPPLEAIKKDGFLEKSEGCSSENKEHEAENISKVQEKLQSLMLHSVSNQGEDEETSVKEWLKQPKNGNEDRNAEIRPRWSAIDSASSLSLLLMEFMIITPDQEGSIMKKLQSLKSTLKAISQDNNTLLINKMLCVMEMVDKEAMDKKTKAGVVTESQVDEFIALFYELLLDLENITAFPARPKTEGSESGAERWRRARLKVVESLVSELKKKQGSGDFEDEKMGSLEMRIVVMWDQVKEEMGEEQPGSAGYSYPMQLFLKMQLPFLSETSSSFSSL